MPEVSAADAARNFADLLDAVEHRGKRFTIVRRGKAIAHLEPMKGDRGSEAKAMLRRRYPDRSWAGDLQETRGLLKIDNRR